MPVTSSIFKQYKKNISIFIETGSYLGDGIAAALSAGFSMVYSIEFNPTNFYHCKGRFQGVSSVDIMQGSSVDNLKLLLPKINTSVLFWLDAHDNEDLPNGSYPLLDELEQIKQHSIHTHTILIDDRRLFKEGSRSLWGDVTENKVITKLKEINSNYNISLIDSSMFEKDIILAEV
jgi:hypothetical protein